MSMLEESYNGSFHEDAGCIYVERGVSLVREPPSDGCDVARVGFKLARRMEVTPGGVIPHQRASVQPTDGRACL